MGGDPDLGNAVHLFGADLDLDALTLGPENSRVQGPIAVGLGGRDVILEAFRDHRVGAVNDAESPVAIFDRVDDDAEGHDV